MLSKARAASLKDAHRTKDELSRILDPSYTSSSTTTTSTYGAYVDAQGNMHDPDYRHFPLIQNTSHYSARRRSSKSSHRPHWELVDEEALLLNEEDLLLQEDTETGYYTKRNSWTVKPTQSSPSHYSPSRRSSYPPAYSGAILSPTDVSPPTSWSSSSASSESSSPESACSSVLEQRRSSPFDAVSEKSKCRIASSLSRKRRRSAAVSAKRASHDYEDEDYAWYRREEEPVAEEEEEEEEEAREYATEDEDEEDEPRRGDDDSVPTCTESLKRKWQALSLSIRFGMFRAERRIKRRVQSLI